MPPAADAPNRTTHVVDTVVGGDTLRIVLDGMPPLRARTAAQALGELRHRHEAFRRFLLEAPHGHAGINACLVLPPLTPGCDRTVVLAAQFGYAPMAGTALMAAAAVLNECTPASAAQRGSECTFDTAIGPGRVQIRPASPNAPEAHWFTRRPQVLAHALALSLPGGTEVRATLVDSGLPYVVTELHEHAVEDLDQRDLSRIGAAVARTATATRAPGAAGGASTTHAYIAMLVGTPRSGGDGGAVVPVAWVSANGVVAAGPGGTGALAVAAYLQAEDRLPVDAGIGIAGPAGAPIHCRIRRETAEVTAVVHIGAERELPDAPLE